MESHSKLHMHLIYSLYILIFGGALWFVNADQCALQSGVEILGKDVSEPTPTLNEQACCNSCAADSACKFFTYEGGTHGLCHHKSAHASATSRQNVSCTSGYVGVAPPSLSLAARVHVSVGNRRHQTGSNFLCWNIDASRNREFFNRNLSASDPASFGAQLARQAAEIGKRQGAGYSLLRFGGTGNDYLTYALAGTPCPQQTDYTECLNETTLRDLFSFADKANAKVIFGLSLNTGKDRRLQSQSTHDPGFPFPWNPENARKLLSYLIEEGFAHLVAGLELGNEQNKKYTAAQAAQNLAILNNLTSELFPDAAKRPKLYGPDSHGYHKGKIGSYVADFVRECEKLGVPLYGATHHEYIEVDATLFTSAERLEVSGQLAKEVNASIRSHNSQVKIVAGEIGPHNAGSPVCDHTMMRWANFGDSLWYADALAAKARYGYETFCRQDYIGADYGLVDCSTGTPLPDYYTALVWAQTMGDVVLNVDPSPVAESTVRIYGHCTAASEPSVSKTGAVTLLVVNLGDGEVVVHAPPTFGDITQVYILSPSSNPADSLINNTGLLSTAILLNGELLKLNSDGSVPSLSGSRTATRTVEVPASSIAFLVLGEAGHSDCRNPRGESNLIV